jgi:hypothetical protein
MGRATRGLDAPMPEAQHQLEHLTEHLFVSEGRLEP